MRRPKDPDRRAVSGRKPDLKTAIAVINAHKKALSAVGARRDVIASLDGAIRLMETHVNENGSLFDTLDVKVEQDGEDPLRGKDLAALQPDEVLRVVEDESVGRKTLERIAIERFSVPRGSMRSFSSIPLLREKILTLMRNDAGHQMILNVSRAASGK